ncbi:kinesin-like protein Klp10A isoform X2 [Contarinia nasturtii]|uniref:kinesin-like protein Klp10A isoform X2 n=1 Tax=Contarinia nasturtii TaxID=265458 RepID=UPI0012D3F4AE|nr:kinesin-like protein Klp10A isoform X2 [Contarinia nasturtii]
MPSWIKKRFQVLKKDLINNLVITKSQQPNSASKDLQELCENINNERITNNIKSPIQKIRNDLKNEHFRNKSDVNAYHDYAKWRDQVLISQNNCALRCIKEEKINNTDKNTTTTATAATAAVAASPTVVVVDTKRSVGAINQTYDCTSSAPDNRHNHANNKLTAVSASRDSAVDDANCDSESRIHSAMVSKINYEARSVTVEWYERNETKGKEIELDTILQLNAELAQQEELAASMPKIIKQTSSNALTRDQTTNSSDEQCDDDEDEEDSYYDEDGQLPTAMVMSTEKTSGQSISNNGSGATLSIRNTKSDATQGNIRFNRGTGNQHSMSYASNGNRTARTTTNQNGQGDHIENIPPQSQLPTKTSSIRNTSRMSMVQPAPAPAPVIQTTATNPTGRRSYVVKEVERLKENREKRRAQQAEMKEQKNALMNMDPGNPNWELAAMIREYQSQIDFRPLTDGQAIEDHQITVCVRKRPVSRKEVMKKELDVISVPNKDQLIVHEPKTKVDLTKYLENHKFRFDYAFDDSCTNELVYKYTAKPLVKTIFEGGMATCFAYGQTGSGKTHTMGGQFNGKTQDCKNGIYAMATKDVFSLLNGPKYRHLNLMISCSFFEIYSGKVFDLLGDKQKLRVLEDGKQQVQVVGLTEKVVDSVEEVLKLIQHGNVTRTSGQTSANANSSRSHAVFQIVLRPPGSTRIHGKFSFIDLAGNERGADTSSANRQTRMEGAEINKSLLALKECIRALGKQNAHLPFRVSKLTQVLRDSFIGEKSKTCMIAMISPGLNSCEHTLNTLRYANRVKELVVQDPEMRNDDVEEMESDDNHKNGDTNENEYAHLRSLSEHDMSDDLLNQHAAISEIQQAEEIVVDQHKAINEFLTQLVPETIDLYNMTNNVDYDQDAYSKRGEEIFSQLADLATTCRNLMADFRGKLANEEMLSHNVHPGKR